MAKLPPKIVNGTKTSGPLINLFFIVKNWFVDQYDYCFLNQVTAIKNFFLQQVPFGKTHYNNYDYMLVKEVTG